MNKSYTPEQLSAINLQAIIESNNSSNEMADALKATVPLLKTFDGNINHLEAFINIIDKFYNRYYKNDESQKEFVDLAIQSKLIGEANDFILTRPDLTTWPAIREALRLKFGDPISRQNLTQQLMFLTKPRHESTLDYVNKLKSLVHRITSKLQAETLDYATKLALIAQTELTATHNLMSNVPQELKTILIIQNPTDLTTAQNLITNYEMINNQLTFKSHFGQASNPPKPVSTYRPPVPFTQIGPQAQANFNNYPRPQFQQSKPFPSQPIHVRPQMSKIQTNFPTNRQVFGKPQNVFRPANNTTNFAKPTPMSGVSIQPRKPINHQAPNDPRIANSFSNQNHNNYNYWRNNPHANPLVFQEITHLENPEGIPGDEEGAFYDPEHTLDYQNHLEPDYPQTDMHHEQPVSDDGQEENFQIKASEELYHA